MIVVNLEILTKFAQKHADVRPQIQAWHAEAEESQWKTPDDIRQRYPTASFLADNRVVFNLKGTKYRLVVKISYEVQIVMIEKVGTHAEYSKWGL